MKKVILIILSLVVLVWAQFPNWSGRGTTATSNGAPDYIYMSNFISAEGLDTTTWASIGADIYGNNPSGKFTTYAPFVLPTFFDSTSYLVSVTTSQIVIYAGQVNTRWDIAVSDIDDRNPITYNDESLAIFARMTTQPNATRKQLISDFIDSLKTKASVDLWANADLIYDFAAQDSQASKLCWTNASFNITSYGTPTWTANTGVAGNGTTTRLETNYIPSSSATHYAQNSACAAIYIRTHEGAANKFDFGVTTPTNKRILHASCTNLNQMWANLNENNTGATPANTDSRGFYIVSRTDAATKFIQRNTTQTDANANSVGLPEKELYIAAHNNDGTAAGWTARQFSFFYLGVELSKADALILNRIVEWYHDQKGIGVQ